MNKFLLIALAFMMIINFSLTIKTRQEFVAGASVGSDEVEKRQQEWKQHWWICRKLNNL